MAAAKGLPDQSARIAALTELQRSLLVEAGAGSGKTSIMAGRVAMLFARGVEPKRVAAITFTEFAASELLIRITRFVDKLAKGEIPPDLEIAFPKGVSAEQRANLDRARKSLDQLVCSTIHGFAQALIKPYPVEAEIDPGAEIIDPSEADLAFGEHYDAWLRDHLSGQTDDDIVAEFVLADENHALELLQNIADFRRHNRDARPASVAWSAAGVEEFAGAVKSFTAQTLADGVSRARHRRRRARFRGARQSAEQLGPSLRSTEQSRADRGAQHAAASKLFHSGGSPADTED